MSKENLNSLATRLIALLLMTAFFLSLLYPQKSQAAFHHSSSFGSPTIAPLFSPPEPFQVSSSTSRNSSFNLSVLDLTSNILNLFSVSHLLEGFEMAKTPTLTDKISSFFAPLFFAPNSSATTAALLLPSGTTSFDFDGDGKADVARWQRASTEWKVKNSSNGSFSTNLIGSVASVIAPADYDGDGKTDAAVFNPSTGTWTIKRSSNGTTQTITGFGQTGDKPVSGDYDGDGLADAALWRPSNGTWYVRQSSNGATVTLQFGAAGDIPVEGNYDGDSKMDYAVFRPSNGIWYVWVRAINTYSGFQWGSALDLPVPADYDGDGKTDYAINRGGQWWYCRSSTNNSQYVVLVWGNYRDQPVPADYDGDGKADLSIWRETDGVWHILRSSDGIYAPNALGATGDVAVEAAYLKQVGGEVFGSDLSKARLAPKNATGGTNLYSRNFSWGSQLVGLAGRAGLDVGLGISYNSLVWTKQGSTMVFDADSSNISFGFRLGFASIEPSYYDSQTGRFNYLLVTPSGGRVEFKQIGASEVYETADSAYTRLKTVGAVNPNDPVENITLTVLGTDGTQSNYGWKAGAFRCTQIKDANGNFITMSYSDFGKLQTVTDTLGRVVNVNYDSSNQPTSITQSWKDNNGAGAVQTHTYATFDYTASVINPSFDSSITFIYGPQGSTERLLQRITFADGSSTRFDYNAYGQVYQVSNYAADNHELNHTRVNLSNSEVAAGQADCPRFSETRSYTENFNGEQETIVTNSLTENQSYNVGGISGSGTLIQVALVGHPNQAISKTFVGATGWQEGLPQATEDWADGARQRWTWSNWTQDDTTKTYIVNPRVVESKVGDATNTKRTTVEYYPLSQSSPVALYGLVKEVKVYNTNQTTVLKRATTEYNLSQIYLDKRIIGLPSKSELFDENGFLTSKITYNYDEENFAQEPEQNIAPINHDTTNFGINFIIGRGNQTSTTRWDVNFPDNASQAVTSRVRYDIAGSVVAQIDALDRKVKINYTDAFNDNQNRNSFAYPTKLTDAAGNFSLVKYRFDIGANVWAKSPAPQNQTSGKITERLFDSIGRISRETLVNNGAYTRYEYPSNQIQAKVYSTIVDTNGNGADANDEVLAESWTDGAGRVRQSRTELPNSTGGFSGSLVEYDILSRVTRSSVPTEINSSWTPAGDDLTRGWLWQSNEYDWKGRITRTANTDGTDSIANYDGCGYAGGQITTVKGEEIIETDWQGQNPVNLGRRTQKIYADIQDRTYKTQVMNWDGVTPYTTTLVQFNGRDQAVSVKQYQDTETSQIFQETTQTFDGHGRVKTIHRPEQDTNKTTLYNYNSDDSVQSVVDARGATANYSYDSRGLLIQMSYAVPTNSTIPIPATVGFSYDNLGNRTLMTDALGTTSYAYDQISRLTAETRTISDVQSGFNQSFTFNYGYGLAGQLISFSDVGDGQRNLIYERDRIGRLTAIGGNGFAGVMNYVSNLQYRAFGGVKSMTFGSGKTLTQTFDNRLQLQRFDIGQTLGSENRYYADGGLKQATDLYDARYSRFNRYDQTGRIATADSGGLYQQYYSYNAFGDLTGRTGTVWGEEAAGYSATYINHRRQEVNWEYDADGRQTKAASLSSYYDASGRRYKTFDSQRRRAFPAGLTIEQGFDGDGQRIKQKEGVNISYQVRSSVLGEIVYEVSKLQTASGGYVWRKANGVVTLAGRKIAVQREYADGSRSLDWHYENPLTGSTRQGNGFGGTEPDPLGVNAGRNPLPPPPEEPPPIEPDIIYPRYGDALNLSTGCTIDGQPISCDLTYSLLGGAAAQCPNNDCGPRRGSYTNLAGKTTNFLTSGFRAGADGSAGFGVPAGIQRMYEVDLMILAGRTNIFAAVKYFNGGGIDVGKFEVTVKIDFDNEVIDTSSLLSLQLQTRQQYEPLPATPKLRDKLVERVDDKANSGRCRKFLEGVLKDLKIASTIEDLFDAVAKNGGFVLVNDLAQKTGKSGSARYGSKSPHPIGIQSMLKGDDKFQSNQRVNVYINTIIHELIHRAGVSGHERFGEAAFNALSDKDKKLNRLPAQRNDRSYEDYFTKRFNDNCRYDPYAVK